MKSYSEYRAQARETLKGRWNEMALLMLVLSFISVVFVTPNYIGTLAEIPWLALSGSSCSLLVTWLITVPLSYAFYNLCLAYARREELEDSYFAALFKDFAANWSKYVLSGLLVGVLVALIVLPTLLIGAIILGLAYAMVPFVIRDYKELGVREVLRTSRMMMRGHKWQLFILELTFIGWALLCILSLGIGLLWLTPYMTATYAHFYEDVKAEYEAKQAATKPVEVQQEEA